jgi:hypothetical protein
MDEFLHIQIMDENFPLGWKMELEKWTKMDECLMDENPSHPHYGWNLSTWMKNGNGKKTKLNECLMDENPSHPHCGWKPIYLDESKKI